MLSSKLMYTAFKVVVDALPGNRIPAVVIASTHAPLFDLQERL